MTSTDVKTLSEELQTTRAYNSEKKASLAQKKNELSSLEQQIRQLEQSRLETEKAEEEEEKEVLHSRFVYVNYFFSFILQTEALISSAEKKLVSVEKANRKRHEKVLVFNRKFLFQFILGNEEERRIGKKAAAGRSRTSEKNGRKAQGRTTETERAGETADRNGKKVA